MKVISLTRVRGRGWKCLVVVGNKGEELIIPQSHSFASENM